MFAKCVRVSGAQPKGVGEGCKVKGLNKIQKTFNKILIPHYLIGNEVFCPYTTFELIVSILTLCAIVIDRSRYTSTVVKS